MKSFLKLIGPLLLTALSAISPALAQTSVVGPYANNTTAGYLFRPVPMGGLGPTGNAVDANFDAQGNLLVSAAGSGGGTVTANQGAAGTSPWEMALYLGATPISVGQQLAAASIPVVLASDQNHVSANLTSISGTTYALGQTTMSASAPVVIASNQSAIPISAASLPLPTGASTAANQVAFAGTTGSPSTSILTVQGNASGVAIPVSVSSFPANQSINEAQIAGSTTATAATGVQKVGVVGNAGAAFDQAPGSAVPANGVQIGGTDGTNLRVPQVLSNQQLAVAGGAATNSTIGTAAGNQGYPVNIGAQAVSSENAAVTTAKSVQLVSDLTGKLIIMPYANKENFVSGVATASNSTSQTSLIPLVSSQKIYITSVSFINTGATTTLVTLENGSGGATVWYAIVPAGGGYTTTFPTPLVGTSAGTALYFVCASASTAVYASAAGYSGT